MTKGWQFVIRVSIEKEIPANYVDVIWDVKPAGQSTNAPWVSGRKVGRKCVLYYINGDNLDGGSSNI